MNYRVFFGTSEILVFFLKTQSTAIAYADLGGFPCIFITGQKPIRSSKVILFIIILCSLFTLLIANCSKENFKSLMLLVGIF
jgi:hypothetical protein